MLYSKCDCVWLRAFLFRTILESKSKLYDKLSKCSDFTEEENEHNKRYLVRFDRKTLNNELPPSESDNEMDIDNYPESEEDSVPYDYEPAKNSEDEWYD